MHKFLRGVLLLSIVMTSVSLLHVSSQQRLPVADDSCKPYGDPIRTTGAYYVCTESKYRMGMAEYDELRLTCKENTAHPGARWHLWCQPNESRCGCNKHDVEEGMSTCCGRTAAAHCTDANPGRPGGNGCATWNDEGH